ncbi:N-acetylmuramoyl-L-alanine amidase [Peribacillus deserti]|uniref:N-acetylmuramoyl-L-alanine amidase n=1 Tax=Peribacillus deserti TaxID=673318 RepID=A0ABS2QDS2_9BACI|nr:N-acetylmuramoyl-L-alanine amidase [Peribacillus deserti]MBM7691242.1 N-acetylmuramoyl-L-alanine amidase [Peribacillus deserti]
MTKQLLVTALLLLALLGQNHVKAYAEKQEFFKVGATSLNIRSNPDIHSEVVGSIPNRTQISVTEEQHGWVKVTYNGKSGWIASQFIYQTEGQETKHVRKSTSHNVTVKETGVRLRTGPGTGYSVVGTAEAGKAYQELNRTNGWVQIQLTGGNKVWISSTYTTSSFADKPSSPVKSLSGRTFIIDAGHGGSDPGALSFNGLQEKDFTLRASQAIALSLKQAGAQVMMTRNGDEFLTPAGRVSFSSRHSADVFISIHFNAFTNPGARGISTYYYTNGSDRDLAAELERALSRKLGLPNDGAKFGDYYVLRENPKLAVLIELGFITSRDDMSVIQNRSFNELAADAVTEGLSGYYQ